MTPPDSGETKLCGHVERERMCLLPAGHAGLHGQDLDDSGEREVPNHTVCIGWPTIRRVAAEGGVYFADSDVALVAADDLFHSDAVPVPPPLVQRILAALEGKLTPDGCEESAALAAELRAAVERKT